MVAKDAVAVLDTKLLCRVSSTGRVTGRRHTIEIWFAHHQGTVYLLSGGGSRSDWVRNILDSPEVSLDVAPHTWSGLGRVVDDPGEARLARDLVHDRYHLRYPGDLTGWRDGALPVAIDLQLTGTS